MIAGPLGILLTAIALCLISTRQIKLVTAVFFFGPMFDLRLVTIGGTGLTPFHVVGALLILSELLAHALAKRNTSFVWGPAATGLVGFLAVIWLSLVMTIVQAGRVSVVRVQTSYVDYDATVPLAFDMSNITQALFPTFGILVALAVRSSLRSDQQIRSALEGFFQGVLAVAVSGLIFQLGYVVFGAPFVEGFEVALYGGDIGQEVSARAIEYNTFGILPRMFSVSGEPSFTASVFLIAVAVGLSLWLGRRSSWGSHWTPVPTWVLVTMLASTLMTFSTTAYLGLLTAVPAGLLLFAVGGGIASPALRTRLVLGLGAAFGAFAVVAMILFMQRSALIDYLMNEHLSKLTQSAGSGAERLRTVLYSMEVFRASPFLGVGWGSHRSAALLTTLLSNLGLMGLFVLTVFNVRLVRLAHLAIKRSSASWSGSVGLACGGGAVAWLLVSMIATTGVALSFGWYWLMVGISMACIEMARSNAGMRVP